MAVKACKLETQRQKLLFFEKSRYLSETDSPPEERDPVEEARWEAAERAEAAAHKAETITRKNLLCSVDLAETADQLAAGHS